jgi:hypothetical protein
MWDGVMRTGLVWLRIGTGGELVWIRYWTFGFHEMLGNYLVASRVVLSSIEFVSSKSKDEHAGQVFQYSKTRREMRSYTQNWTPACGCLWNHFNDSAGDMRGSNDFKTQLASCCAIFIPGCDREALVCPQLFTVLNWIAFLLAILFGNPTATVRRTVEHVF